MSKKITIRVVLLVLVVVLGIFVLYSIVSAFIPRHGTVARIADIQKVYSNEGPPLTATLTNSLIQKFPFIGPVNWELWYAKSPLVILTGKVDTNVLHQFIDDHPTTEFVWEGASGEQEEGWPSARAYPRTTWTNTWFKVNEVVAGYQMTVEGKVDLRARVGIISIY